MPVARRISNELASKSCNPAVAATRLETKLCVAPESNKAETCYPPNTTCKSSRVPPSLLVVPSVVVTAPCDSCRTGLTVAPPSRFLDPHQLPMPVRDAGSPA